MDKTLNENKRHRRMSGGHCFFSLSLFLAFVFILPIELFRKYQSSFLDALKSSQRGETTRVIPLENTVTVATENWKKRKPYKRIDFYTCPRHGVGVAAKTSYGVGVGHRMTENLFMLWYAMINGYCFCFETMDFGHDIEVYHLLLESIIPTCKTIFPNRTLQSTSFEHFQKQTISIKSKRNDDIVHWIEVPLEDVWPTEEQGKRPRGNGDLYAFVDSFFRDNQIVEHVIVPWYHQHKTIDSAFQRVHHNKTNTMLKPPDFSESVTVKSGGADRTRVLTGAFHLRVGDIILDAIESYWRNVLATVIRIVDLEFGPDFSVEIYWIYFRSDHRVDEGDDMRLHLANNTVGVWPSEPDMLPESHPFIATLCHDMDRIQCYWKEGTNILESIDLHVQSDIVFVSGSSFSQLLSLFNQGIRLVAITKEIHTNEKGAVPFLRTSTSAFSSLQHYYIDGTGQLFPEQYVHLRLRPLK